MTTRLLLLVLLFSLSCLNQNEIIEFEKAIGEKHSKTLTILVDDFEQNYLAKQYREVSIKKAYKKFLEDIKDYKIQKRIQATPEIVNKIKESGFYEELYAITDSVWYNRVDNMYHTRTKVLLPNGEYKIGGYESSYGLNATTDEAETIKKHYSLKDRNFYGKYWSALRTVGEHERYIFDYIDINEAMGRTVASNLATGFINSRLDYDDYFVKRIIVTEFVEY